MWSPSKRRVLRRHGQAPIDKGSVCNVLFLSTELIRVHKGNNFISIWFCVTLSRICLTDPMEYYGIKISFNLWTLSVAIVTFSRARRCWSQESAERPSSPPHTQEDEKKIRDGNVLPLSQVQMWAGAHALWVGFLGSAFFFLSSYWHCSGFFWSPSGNCLPVFWWRDTPLTRCLWSPPSSWLVSTTVSCCSHHPKVSISEAPFEWRIPKQFSGHLLVFAFAPREIFILGPPLIWLLSRQVSLHSANKALQGTVFLFQTPSKYGLDITSKILILANSKEHMTNWCFSVTHLSWLE